MSVGAHIQAVVGSAMLASSSDCVKLLSLCGTIEYINPSGLALMDMDEASSPVGQAWVTLWPDHSRHTVMSALKTSRAGNVARFTEICPTRKGANKWWDVAVSPMRNDDGIVNGHLCVSRDVTRQKAMENSLLLSEQRFRALADNMVQLAWMADAAGNVFWYNKRWTDYTGTTCEEMAGTGWRKVHHPQFVDYIAGRIHQAFRNNKMWEDVVPLKAADGSFRWFLSRAVPVRDKGGRVVLWCATHTDLSEQRNLSHRLRQLARVIEMSHEAILVWSPEDGIMLWNKGCEELYGYRRGEALGASTHDLLKTRHPDGLAAFERELERDGTWSGEIVHYAKDGSEVWVDSRQELIRAGGRNLILETSRDITERRKADALRDLLVAELNHRVKNTLAVVQSLASQTARTQTDMRSFVSSFTGRLQSLAAAQTILSDAHWAGASLDDLVRSQLATTVGSSEQVSVEGESVFLTPQTALQLTLVFHELATNARRHGALSTPGGKVEISWSLGSGDAPEVEIVWRESGGPPVVPPGAQGLGRKLIERTGLVPHLRSRLQFLPGGVECRIWVSATGEGDGVMPYFNPGSQRVEFTGQARRAAKPRWDTHHRILVIDDDPLDALLLEEVLGDAGYLVVGPMHAPSEIEHALGELAFDAAIIDADFPAIDLERVLRKLKASGRPVLTLGGTSPPGDISINIPRPLLPSYLLEQLSALLSDGT